MGIDLFFVAVIILMIFAIFDLIVGVSNDAVNFLNSSLGSKVAPRFIIMIVASLGIVLGVSFSSGMMEVARKGIFHPEFFNMPELMVIFLAVMFTDIILLDLFNTYGLPTSTTVSIVFELLGGAVAVSIIKIINQSGSLEKVAEYINTEKAMVIIFGILLSIIVSFFSGAIIQFFTRMLFTFDYKKRLKRYGAIWGGIALSLITYFILIKGAKGAVFISEVQYEWIKTNTLIMMGIIFVISAIILQVLLFLKINVLKPIVLVGTFALAMAFAANDLVNFIGVPMAGFHTYQYANKTEAPTEVLMSALSEKVPAELYMLLIAGLIMVVTLWVSKKSRTVSETEINLSYQGENEEKFGSTLISRVIVLMAIAPFDFLKKITPKPIKNWFSKRFDTTKYTVDIDTENRPSFDLLRASVNLMVASAVISFATSQKLPLSTTYVTFMVAMGSSFSDRAWGRESAVYRVTGVLTVVVGWFMTALIAFTTSGLMATLIFYTEAIGVVILLLLVTFIIWRNHLRHKEREKSKKSDMDLVFRLKKITNVDESISITFEQIGFLINEINNSLNRTLNALYKQNSYTLRDEKKKSKTIQHWSYVISANIFKTLRLMNKEHIELPGQYSQTIRRIQKLSDGYRDIVSRAHEHVSNHHKGLIDIQVEELKIIQDKLSEILSNTEYAFVNKDFKIHDSVESKHKELKEIIKKQNYEQVERVLSETSKTRISILFYSILGNTMMISKQNIRLLEIFSVTLSEASKFYEFDMD